MRRGRVLAVRDPAIARWNPVDRPDPDLRVAQAWVEDRGDWTGSEHASFAVVTADDDALFTQVMRVGSYPDPDRKRTATAELKRSAPSGWLKLPTRAGDLGRSPFNGIAEYVGPAPAAAVVGVVVVPAVNAVVVGGFGPTGGGVAHRQEGTGPHWLASITTVVAHSGVRSRVGLRPCRPASSAITLASGGERFLDCRGDTATVGDLIPVGLGPLTNCLSLFLVRTGGGYRCRLRSSP